MVPGHADTNANDGGRSNGKPSDPPSGTRRRGQGSLGAAVNAPLVSFDVSDVPILVTGVVALGVPAITALWARSNQAKALEHDRQVRDLEELRKLLDAATDLLAEGLAAELGVRGVRLWDRALETSSEGNLTKRAIDNQRALVNIGMRLGRDSPVATQYRLAVVLLQKVGGILDHEKDSEAWKSSTAQLGVAQIAFTNEANKLVASRLPLQVT
jgi:hypothetical protein